ncbi:hypothetical protein NMY22_g17517 [Coprinellus aureogranulatus]|nr:hypothetical protein NMY22_g17517 [Coprinellus aureogranulatus]
MSAPQEGSEEPAAGQANDPNTNAFQTSHRGSQIGVLPPGTQSQQAVTPLYAPYPYATTLHHPPSTPMPYGSTETLWVPAAPSIHPGYGFAGAPASSPFHLAPPLVHNPGTRTSSPLPFEFESEYEKAERLFGAGLFEGILYPKESRKRSRAKFIFPDPDSKMDAVARAVVLHRCIERAGLSLGSSLRIFLSGQHMFSGEFNAVGQAISSFLRSDSPTEGPVAIVQYIFQNPKSSLKADMKVDQARPTLSVPAYALPPSVRLDGRYTQEHPNSVSTKNALLDWCFQKTMQLVDEESEHLLQASLGFTRAPSEYLSWSNLTSWSITASQEIIAREAPAVFALLSTLAVNPNMRKRIEQARFVPSSGHNAPEPMPPSSPPQFPEPDQDTMDVEQEDPTPTMDAETMVPEREPFPSASEEAGDAIPEIPSASPFLEAVPPSLSGVPENTRRDPWLGATIAILSLLYLRYKYAIVFPTVIGVFLFTCNANRDIISILGRIGLTVAYDSILTTLHILANDADYHLRSLASLIQNGQPKFLLLFDNVNKMRRAWQQTMHHRDEMESGTAATLIELEDVPPDALQSKPLQDALKEKRRSELTVEILAADIDWDHIEAVGAATVLRVWIKHIPALRKFQNQVEELFTDHDGLAKHRLRLRKSKITPMRPTAINEATTAGTLEVLRNLIVGQLRILPNWLDPWLILVCGDQLTVDRIRKSKRYMAKTDTAYDRQDWAVPMIQLWHLKWNWQKAIFRMNWSPELGDGIYGVRYSVHALRRDKFNHLKCDFYPGHAILEDQFDALVLDGLRLLCEEKTKDVYPPNTKLLEGVQCYFTKNENLANVTFATLLSMAQTIYTRYLAAAAADEAKQPTTEGQLPDQALANTANFMRTTFWYLELCAATAEGDIGRLLRFSFWGAGSTNYGNEMLELACNFLYEFSEGLKTAIMNNYLVNPSGRLGHWFELDLLQEHFNFWLKRLFNAKSHSFDSRHLSEAVGLNIGGFSLLRDTFPSIFGLRKNKPAHTDPAKHTDINRLGEHYRTDNILIHKSGRTQPYEVINEFGKGYEILELGRRAAQDLPRSHNERWTHSGL